MPKPNAKNAPIGPFVLFIHPLIGSLYVGRTVSEVNKLTIRDQKYINLEEFLSGKVCMCTVKECQKCNIQNFVFIF